MTLKNPEILNAFAKELEKRATKITKLLTKPKLISKKTFKMPKPLKGALKELAQIPIVAGGVLGLGSLGMLTLPPPIENHRLR